tara:strand:- start:1213 stop:1416 length:204 start_codon:yes stop_codon:yes gene_type:complete
MVEFAHILHIFVVLFVILLVVRFPSFSQGSEILSLCVFLLTYFAPVAVSDHHVPFLYIARRSILKTL